MHAGGVYAATCLLIGRLDPAFVTSPRLFRYLQINRMGVEQHGGVKEWLDKSATKFADRVEIVESFVSTPTLVLKTDDDADENDGATTSKGKKAKAKKSRGSGFDNLFGVGEGSAINIGSWKIEHIDAFLVSKLKSAGDT